MGKKNSKRDSGGRIALGSAKCAVTGNGIRSDSEGLGYWTKSESSYGVR